MPPLVSCILCTYNRENFLREALDGVFAQTYPRYEMIVVDDASANIGLFKILESYGQKIRLVRREKNSGTCELPRYQGVQQSQGKYCAFLDSDDLWAPEKLAKQVQFMEEHPEIPLCHTGASVVDEKGRVLYVRHQGNIPATGSCGRELLKHCFISVSSIMVRRETWLNAQRLEDIRHLGMEWDFLIQIARRHPIGFIPEVLASYRTSAEGITKNRWRWNPRDILSLDRILSTRLWEGLVTRREMLDQVAEAYLENAEYNRHGGHPLRAGYFCLRGWRHQPLRIGYLAALLKVMGSALRPHRLNLPRVGKPAL